MAQKDNLISASKNSRELIRILSPLLSEESKTKLENEIEQHSVKLYKLGESHFKFAESLPDQEWRQKISRCYYGAYNCKRALMLFCSRPI